MRSNPGRENSLFKNNMVAINFKITFEKTLQLAANRSHHVVLVEIMKHKHHRANNESCQIRNRQIRYQHIGGGS